MNDYHVPMWGVLAVIGWLAAFALMILGWTVFLGGSVFGGIMLGLSGLFMATVSVSLTSKLIAGEVLTRVQREKSDSTGF